MKAILISEFIVLLVIIIVLVCFVVLYAEHYGKALEMV